MKMNKYQNIESTLLNIKADSSPKFGVMNAQQMVEHLIFLYKISINEIELPVFISKESLPKMREFLFSDQPIKPGFKAPLPAADLVYSNISESIKILLEYVNKFDDYYLDNPDNTANSPAFGELDYKGWCIFHDKHNRHHFEQFGLL